MQKQCINASHRFLTFSFVSVQRTRAHVTVDKVRVCLTRFEESSACVTINPTNRLTGLVQVSVFERSGGCSNLRLIAALQNMQAIV